MVPRLTHVTLFIPCYAWLNRRGWLDRPAARRLFSKTYFFYKQYLEDPFTPLLSQYPHLFRGGAILDVGANIGYTAALFATVLSPGFRIYAFEPEERNFELLRQNVIRLGLERKVIPIQAAVGDREGNADLWLNPGHHADHRMVTAAFRGEAGQLETQNVPLVRLDDFCAKTMPGAPICFIKIDVQGYEECVCNGMVEILFNNPQAFVGLEYYPEGIECLGFKPSTILHFFEKRRYSAYVLSRRRGLQAIAYGAIPQAVGPKGYMDLVFSKSDRLVDGIA